MVKAAYPIHCHLFSSVVLGTEYFYANSLPRARASPEVGSASPQVGDGSGISQDVGTAVPPCSLESWEAAAHLNPSVPQFPLGFRVLLTHPSLPGMQQG